MGYAVMSRLFALLALVAFAASAGLLSGLAGGSAPWRRRTLPAAAVVATVATLGSLYYSEVVGFVPCELCWYQRIAMYPLVAVLGIAAVRRDASAWLPGVVLASTGFALSTWHVLVQSVPSLAAATGCSTTTPCSARLVQQFGFVSIPVMAGAGFLLVIVLLLHTRRTLA